MWKSCEGFFLPFLVGEQNDLLDNKSAVRTEAVG